MTVLLFHAALGAGADHALGTGGVDIFFVLSGFLMFQLVDHAKSPLSFAWARVRRIVPAYWLVTAIVATTQIVGLTESSNFNFEHFIKSILFVPSLDEKRRAIYPVLIVGWTLNYEMFFYAIVTISMLIPKVLRIAVLCVTFSLLIVAKMLIQSPGVLLSFYGDPIIVEFVLGAFVSVMWMKDRLPPRGWWLVTCGALLMIAPQFTIMPRFVSYGIPAAFILVGILAEERHAPLPRIRKLKLLGDASYSIYLWHLFVVAAVFRVFGVAPPVFAFSIIGGVAVGLVSFWMIEKPSIAFLDRRRRQRVRA